MPSFTTNLNLTLYDKVTDNNIKFIDFRDALVGVSASNMTKIDAGFALKANVTSPTFDGTPSAPTAAQGTNTTQLATTAFVNAEIAANAAPLDHVGATGAAHGQVTTSVDGFMIAADKTKLNGIATGAQVNPTFTATATDIKMNGTQSVGALATIARADHVHPVDTSRAAVANLTGTAETLGGTAVVGVATTAARSDHKHAITNPAIDTLAAATDVTTLNASTSAHGLVVKATAPATGLINVVAIGNAETAYTNKPLFDATVPIINGTAATGTATVAARRDHVHPTDTTRQPLGNELTALQALADTAGFLKKTGDGTYAIDTNTYTNYSHPAGDGNLHVPATSTNSSGKILTAGATAGAFSWELPAPTMSFTATPADIKMNGVQAVGVLTTAPRADHVHPTDTSKANLDSPALIGIPTAPTATVGTDTTQLATTAFVNASIGSGVIYAEYQIEWIEGKSRYEIGTFAGSIFTPLATLPAVGTKCIIFFNWNRNFIGNYIYAADDTQMKVCRNQSGLDTDTIPVMVFFGTTIKVEVKLLSEGPDKIIIPLEMVSDFSGYVLSQEIGDSNALTTPNKDSIVDAINSVYDQRVALKGSATTDITNWVASGVSGWTYKKIVPVMGIKSTDVIFVNFDAATYTIASIAGIAKADSGEDEIVLYSDSIPTGSVTFEYTALQEDSGLAPQVTANLPILSSGGTNPIISMEPVAARALDGITNKAYTTIILDETTQITKVIDSYSGMADLVLKGDTLFQAIKNGNLANGITGFSAGSSVLSVLNRVLLVTGNGGSASPSFLDTSGGGARLQSGQKYFIKNRLRVTSAGCLAIKYYLGGNILSKTINNPVQNQWYDTYEVWTAIAGDRNYSLQVEHVYSDASTANGKVLEVDGNVGIFSIPITGTPYENMTATEINNKIGAYFEGPKGATLETVGSRGKNLFDGQLSKGSIDVLTGVDAVQDDVSVRNIGYTPIKPSVVYTYSNQAVFTNNRIYWYDANKNFISYVQATTATSPANARYLRFRTYDVTALNLYNNSIIQLEEGAVATAYEPFDGSQVNISAVRHKLPNLIEDSLEFVDGRWLYYKRTAEYTLLSGDISTLQAGTLSQYVTLGLTPFVGLKPQLDAVIDGSFVIGGFGKELASGITSVGVAGDMQTTVGALFLAFANGTYANLAAAQTALAGTKIVYQLATPLVIEEKDFSAYNITIDGSLSANNGDTEFYVGGYDILADSLVTYPMNIASGTESLKESIEGIQKQIGVGSVIRSTTAPITLYVRTDGSDSNDGSEDTPSKAIKTIQSAISRIPKLLRHAVTIRVASGTYSESVAIDAFVNVGANGSISIKGDTVVGTSRNVTNIVVRSCSTSVLIEGICITSGAPGIYIFRSTNVLISYVNMVNSVLAEYGVVAQLSTTCRVQYSVISNRLAGILATDGSIVSSSNSGVGNTTGLYATNGGTIVKIGSQPVGATAEIVNTGGMFIGEELTTTITSGFAAGWSGSITIRKSFDNLVQVTIALTKSADMVVGTTQLYTLPVGTLPIANVYNSVTVMDTVGNAIIGNVAYNLIVTTGVINFYTTGTITNARTLHMTVMYYSL